MSSCPVKTISSWPCAARALQIVFCKTGKPLEACLGEQGVVAALKSLDSIEYRTPEQKLVAAEQLLNLVDHLITHLQTATPSKIGLFSRAFQAILRSRGLREKSFQSSSLRRKYRVVTLKVFSYVHSTLKQPALCRLTSNLCLFLLAFLTTELPRVEQLVAQAINEDRADDDDDDGIDTSSQCGSEISTKSLSISSRAPEKLFDQLKPDQLERFDSAFELWLKQRKLLDARSTETDVNIRKSFDDALPPSNSPKPSRKSPKPSRHRKHSEHRPKIGLGEAVGRELCSFSSALKLVGDHLLISHSQPLVEQAFNEFKDPEKLDSDSSWLKWIRGWSNNFHSFVVTFVESFGHSDGSTEAGSLAYTEIIKSFLGWMSSAHHAQWDAAEASAVSSVLSNDPALLMPFLKIVFESTNAMDKVQVANLFETLEYWTPQILKHVSEAPEASVDIILDVDYFLSVMKMLLLDLDHYSTAQQTLVLLFNLFPVFLRSSRALAALLKLLVDDSFINLFLHWSPDVRSTYITVIHDRILAAWAVDSHPLLKETATSLFELIDRAKATSRSTVTSELGFIHIASESPKSRHKRKKKERRELMMVSTESLTNTSFPASTIAYIAPSLKQFAEYARESTERGRPQQKLTYKDPMALQLLLERWSN